MHAAGYHVHVAQNEILPLKGKTMQRLRNWQKWVSLRQDDIFLLGTFSFVLTAWCGMWWF
jgi:hypothetical protein